MAEAQPEPPIIDWSTLRRLEYRCDPDLCAGGVCCCASFEVCIEDEELDRLIGLLPTAAAYADAGRGVVDAPFEPLESGVFALETDEDGLCLMAHTTDDGRTLCAFHFAALELGLDPVVSKPRACALWPLSLSENAPARLTVDPSAAEFPCCRLRESPGRLAPELAATLRALYGITE